MNDQDLSHRRTWELIPLVVNGSASAEERRLVDAHLHGCADCRDELAFQTQLQTGMTADIAAPHDPHPALRNLLERLDGDGDATAALHAEAAPRRRPSLLLVAVAGQAVALAVLGGALLLHIPRGGGDAAVPYRTLSSPAPNAAQGTIRFVPAPSLSLRELQTLLGETGLRIVASNADNSIYTLAPAHADAADTSKKSAAERKQATVDALARLRARPGVLLAEPITAAASQGR
jgi:hypothetical protein